MKKTAAAAISATPITPPTTPPAIAPVFDLLLEDVGLGAVVSDAEAVDVEMVEPVDWGLDAVDSGLSPTDSASVALNEPLVVTS